MGGHCGYIEAGRRQQQRLVGRVLRPKASFKMLTRSPTFSWSLVDQHARRTDPPRRARVSPVCLSERGVQMNWASSGSLLACARMRADDGASCGELLCTAPGAIAGFLERAVRAKK